MDETGDAYVIEGREKSPDWSHAQALGSECVDVEIHRSSCENRCEVGFVEDSLIFLCIEDTAASEGVGLRTRGKRTESTAKVLSGEVHGALKELASRAYTRDIAE